MHIFYKQLQFVLFIAFAVINFLSPTFAVADASTVAPTDTLVIHLSEDAFNGDAQFTASIDGVLLTPLPLTVLVHQPSGSAQDFVFTGNWGKGPHHVTINFVNDSWDGTSAADGHDRNLYVNGIDYDTAQSFPAFMMYSNGAANFTINAPVQKADILVLLLSEDAYQGNVQFVAAVDGVSLTQAPQTVLVHNPTGQLQEFTYIGAWGPGSHKVTVTFVNDLWDGTSAADGHDRNIYISSLSFNNVGIPVSTWMYSSGSDTFVIPSTTPAKVVAGSCNGNASGSTYTFTVSSTNGTTTPSETQCPYGGTQPITTTVTQNYSCMSGAQKATGAASITVTNNGAPSCAAPASCGMTLSGSVVTQQVRQTQSSTNASNTQCPWGGTQPTVTTVSQVYVCTNGTLSTQGNSTSVTINIGNPTCTVPQSRYPLGFYVGNPNPGNTLGNSQFVGALNSFIQTMGVSPTYMDTFTNQQDPISHWGDQISWQASIWHATPQMKNIIPVIAFPLNSTQDNAGQDFLDFASGKYDTLLSGMVLTWVQAGYSDQYWRIGWEMNLNGNPGYAGDLGTQKQKDWIAAFQHVYTVVHTAAMQNGATVHIIWNPGVTGWSNTGNAATYFYPGNDFVDIIAADAYADLYTDFDGNGNYYDFDRNVWGDTLVQWESDPINLIHNYSYPGSQGSYDGGKTVNVYQNGVYTTAMSDIINLALSNSKPFAVAETGAGNSSGGRDITDNPVFPQWLSATLDKAKTSGLNILFVNIWDSNGGGTYEFSNPPIIESGSLVSNNDNKPQEALAWGIYFGAITPQPISSTAGAAVYLNSN